MRAAEVLWVDAEESRSEELGDVQHVEVLPKIAGAPVDINILELVEQIGRQAGENVASKSSTQNPPLPLEVIIGPKLIVIMVNAEVGEVGESKPKTKSN